MISSHKVLVFLFLTLSIFIHQSESRNCSTFGELKCQFPFKYNNVTYYGCTNSTPPGLPHLPWCATKLDTDGNMTEWHYCKEATCADKICKTYEGSICQFPFYYNNTLMYHCPPRTSAQHKDWTWCPTKLGACPNETLTTLVWGHCLEKGCSVTEDNKHNDTVNCSSTAATTPPVTKLPVECETEDSDNQTCKFPFEYNGKIYHECTFDGSTNPSKSWCATKWGPCPAHIQSRSFCKVNKCKGTAHSVLPICNSHKSENCQLPLNKELDASTGETYVLKSINYPNNYKPNLNCQYSFTLKNQTGRFELEIVEFKLEPVMDTCSNDILKINSAELHGVHLKPLSACGSLKQRTLKIVEKNLQLEFTTTAMKQAKGFHLIIKSML